MVGKRKGWVKGREEVGVWGERKEVFGWGLSIFGKNVLQSLYEDGSDFDATGQWE